MDTAAPHITQVLLETGPDGRARWREVAVALVEGTPASRLSPWQSASGLQWRESPVGFRSSPHCTGTPQWVLILRGVMGIGLPDGSLRRFGPGDHFFSADVLPPGATFDPAWHGHWSCQIGDDPLVTVFVRG